MISFVAYTVLSWVVFFRDERALSAVFRFYPVAEALVNIRRWLLGVGLNSVATVLFAGVILVAFWAYLRVVVGKTSPGKIWRLVLVSQIIVFFSYPILSTDVLSYILSDRIAVVYNQNVWLTKPSEFRSDPYFALSDWTDQTRIYGPVNQAVYSLATALSGNDLLVNLASHKLVVLVFVLASFWLMRKLLGQSFPDRVSWGLAAVFLNPLLVIETAGSGHNDMVMLFFVIAAAFLFLGERYLGAGLALAIAAQVKSSPLVLLPFFILSVLGQGKLRGVGQLVVSFVVAYVLVWQTTGTTILALFSRTVHSTSVFWQSLPQVLARFFPQGQPLVGPLFGLFLLWQFWRGFSQRATPFILYAQTYLVYLLFVLAAFWNWYPLWVLGVLPLFPWGRLAKVIIGFTFSSMMAYVVYWLALRFNYHHPAWTAIMYATVLSGPVVVFFFHERFFKKLSP